MIDVRLLTDASHHRIIPSGQRVADTSKEMFIVVSGKIDAFHITAQKTIAPAGSLTPGEAFCVREFFYGSAGSVYRASEDTTLFVIAESTFDAIARETPRVVYELLKVACAPAVTMKVLSSADSSEALFPAGHKGYPGIVKPAYEQYVYKKDYKCPYCAKTFKGWKIYDSKLKNAGPTRYDLREYYVDFQTEWYDVVTCPHCYFSMLNNSFTDPKYFVKNMLKDSVNDFKKKITLDFDAPRDLDFVMATVYLALRSAAGYTNSKQIVARLWAYLSWLYEDAEDKDMMRFAAEKCARANEELYSATTLNPAHEQVVCLMTAGMLHRAGITEGIKKWVYNVKVNKQGKKLYADLADSLLDFVRE